MQQEQEILRGNVVSVVFQNPENGYAVLRLRADYGDIETVIGTIPLVKIGEKLTVTGKWVTHPTFGTQFQAEFLERTLPDSADEIYEYLAGHAVKGIGEKTARKIVRKFGTDTLRILEEEPERLTEVGGIPASRAREIGENFRKQIGIRRLLEFMARYRLPVELAARLYRECGEHAIDRIQENPYLLTEDPYLLDYRTADEFALQVGIGTDDARRLEAAILYELYYNLGSGHVFLPEDKLIPATAKMLSQPRESLETAMMALLADGRLYREKIAGLQACYLPSFYLAEVRAAERIRMMSGMTKSRVSGLKKKIANIEEKLQIVYADRQKDAIVAAAENKIMVLTGGPGTGKTTTVKGIIELFETMKLKTMLAAPTGRAAKRLSELTGREASTIHRMLDVEYRSGNNKMTFLHDAIHPLQIDALVLDECSMIDIELMAAVLDALPKKCRLVLVGDPDQLPSVGPGNVFSDIIRSGICPTVHLTEIFRQARESLIVMNAHAINRGEMPEITAKDRDFFFISRASGEDAVQTICDLCCKRLPEKMGIPSSEIQVLSPTRRFETGTGNLNVQLQAALNPSAPGKPEKKYGNYLFRVGDRVMQIRNNYDLTWEKTGSSEIGTGVFNGDIGLIRDIDISAETVYVDFEGKVAEYSFDMLPELEPAYAMTVHKSQGSEYRAVILTVFPGSPYLLTRNVLYTAITRARDLLIVVGNPQVLSAMVENNRQTKRYSGLKQRLSGDN